MSSVLKIDIKITGDKELMSSLRRLTNNMTDFKPELQTVGDFLKDYYGSLLFKTEGAILGSRWINLKPSYEFQKRKQWAGRGILERTGKLKRGYEHKAEPMVLTVANTTDYAKYHHLGGPIIPQRKLIGFSGDTENKIISVFTRAVLVRLNKS